MIVNIASLALVLSGTALAKNVFDFNKASSSHEAKVVPVAIQGKRVATHPIPRYNELHKRASGTLNVELSNLFTYYQIEVELGTPGQKILLLTDTGSSDLWAMGYGNPYCAQTEQELQSGYYVECNTGLFNPNTSSTYHQNSTEFYIQYGDYTFAEGVWGTDSVQFAGVTVTDASIAIGLQSNSSYGVFGIGLAALESSLNSNVEYMNIPQLLVSQGTIDSYSYSLYLDDLEASSGTVLFGGVDHDKYSGTLGLLPMINIYAAQGAPAPLQFNIVLSSVTATNAKGDKAVIQSGNVAALLDSGTSFTYLLTETIQSIADGFGAQFSNELGLYVIDCSFGDQGGNMVYDLAGVEIQVPISELLIPLSDFNVTGENGVCALGMWPTDDPTNIILGDTFLRSAYVVYDLANYVIGIAQTNFNSSSSSLEGISNSIPSAQPAPSYSSTNLAQNIQFGTISAGMFSTAAGNINTALTGVGGASSTGFGGLTGFGTSAFPTGSAFPTDYSFPTFSFSEPSYSLPASLASMLSAAESEFTKLCGPIPTDGTYTGTCKLSASLTGAGTTASATGKGSSASNAIKTPIMPMAVAFVLTLVFAALI